MIRIIDKITGDSYDLPLGVTLSFERNNSFFEETGDFSLSLTLPQTKKNNRLLSHPCCLFFKEWQAASREVIVLHGAYQSAGTLKVISAGRKSGIAISILLKNSDLYSKIGETTMQQIFDKITWNAPPSASDAALWWVNTLEQIYQGNATGNYPFAVFPVTGEENIILNEVMEDGTLRAKTAYQTETDDLVFTVPAGYNLTPFIQLKYVLNQIFKYLDFEFDSSNFSGFIDNIFLLNNTCDTVFSGKIFASHLVPDMAVTDFLDVIRNRFGLDFYIDSDNTVKIKYINDMLNSAAKDFTKKLGDFPEIEFQTPKTVNLTCNHLIPSAADGSDIIQYKTWQELRDNLGPVVETTTPINEDEWIGFKGLVFLKNHNYYTNDIEDLIVTSGDTLDFYEKEKGIEAHEIKSEYTDCVQRDFDIFIGKTRQKVSHEHLGYEGKDADTADLPCMMAYRRSWLATQQGYYQAIPGHSFGTQYSADENGEYAGGVHLVYPHSNGIYNRYYRQFDQYLRKGMHRIRVPLNLTAKEIADYDFYTTVIIDNKRCIPTKLQYDITNESIRVVSAEFLTL